MRHLFIAFSMSLLKWPLQGLVVILGLSPASPSWPWRLLRPSAPPHFLSGLSLPSSYLELNFPATTEPFHFYTGNLLSFPPSSILPMFFFGFDLAFYGDCNKSPQTWSLKATEMYSLLVLEARVCNQGLPRAINSLEAQGNEPVLLLPVLSHSLACGHLSAMSSHCHLCVHLLFPVSVL